MSIKLFTLAFLTAVAVLPCLASAQYSAVFGTTSRAIGRGSNSGGTGLTLNSGDHFNFGADPNSYECVVTDAGFKVTPPNGKPFVLSVLNLPTGTPIRQNGQTYIVHAKSPSLSVALYPFVDFAVAGEIQTGAPGQNQFNGGTTSVYGFIPAVDLSFRDTKGNGLEVGSWYFGEYAKPTNGSSLYNFHARVFHDHFGYEVGYLNDNQNTSQSIMMMLLYDFNNKSLDPIKPSTWAVRLGVGALDDFSDQFGNFSNGTVQHRSSVNLTASWQASYQLDPKTSLIFSTWYARDRVDDLTRFAVGIAWRF